MGKAGVSRLFQPLKAGRKRKGRIVLVLVFFMFLYIGPLILYPYYTPPTILTEQKIQSKFTIAESNIGETVLLEHGTQTYLGDQTYSYSTVLGEYNTFNGSQYVKYLYDDITHNATFAGHSLVLYDWYAVFSNRSQVLVDDMRFIVQYWQTQGGGRWAELDLWEDSFLPAIETENSLIFGQRYTDGFSSLDVWYTVHNYDRFKITLNFTAENTELYRFQWQLTGVDGIPELNNKSLSFNDVNIGWGDSELNATYDWFVSTKKLDISFDNLTIEAGETYILDPDVSPVIGADSDDDWYNFDDGIGWTHNTNSLIVYCREYHQNFYYTGNARYALAIPQGATINSANWTFYEYDDSGDNDVEIFRIDEVNCGSLEADSSIPARDWSDYAIWDVDGSGSEWVTSNITDLVQTQINLGSWSSGYYMGLNINQTATGAGAIFSFRDYQYGSDYSYMNVSYTTGGGTAYEKDLTEGVGAADTIENAAAYDRTYTESIGAADVRALAASMARNLVESIGVVGVLTTLRGREKDLVESITATDVRTFSIDYARNLVEAVSCSDVFSKTFGLNRSESISVVDAGTFSKFIAKNMVETIGVVDSWSRAAGYSRELTENVTATDVRTFSADFVRDLVEAVSCSDVIDAVKGGGIDYEKDLTEAVSVSPELTTDPPAPERSMIYELFLSLEVWGYLGPALLVIGGYILSKKELILGVLWFVLECLIVAQYLALVEATPNYWWHVYIIMIGGLIAFGFAVVGKK